MAHHRIQRMTSIAQRIADQIDARLPQVEAAIALLDGKAPPFRSSPATARKPPAAWMTPSCARSKSASPTCASSRTAARRSSTSHHRAGQAHAGTRHCDRRPRTPRPALEDLYLPYQAQAPHQGRRSRARPASNRWRMRCWRSGARSRGRGAAFMNAAPGVADAKAALDGARDILVEQLAENADAASAACARC